MTTPTIRAALERLVEIDRTQSIDWAWEHENAIAAARAALAEPVGEGPPAVTTSALLHPAYEPGDGSADGAQIVDGEWWQPVFGCDSLQIVVNNARAALAHLGHPAAPPAPAPVMGDRPSDEELYNLADEFAGDPVPAMRAALARWGRPAAPQAPEPPAEALAARPLLEQVARLADRIGAHTVGEITAISDRAAAWLRDNPLGQPVSIEPRSCPTPGACSCVKPAPAVAPPSGYAYRYPDGIRFNNGNEVNGCRPSEAIPYWFSQPPAPAPAVVPPDPFARLALLELERNAMALPQVGEGQP